MANKTPKALAMAALLAAFLFCPLAAHAQSTSPCDDLSFSDLNFSGVSLDGMYNDCGDLTLDNYSDF
jgi:hypothetical protein